MNLPTDFYRPNRYRYDARTLLAAGATLNEVNRLVGYGHVSIEQANAFFHEWCKGKLEHRWNEAGGYGEECILDRRTGQDTWRRWRWL